jgi:hypothetical protein
MRWQGIIFRDDPGKWRISRENTSRDQLRELVLAVGLWQYLLAPLLVVLAGIHITRSNTPGQRRLGFGSAAAGLVAVSLALYRGYFSSLGL